MFGTFACRSSRIPTSSCCLPQLWIPIQRSYPFERRALQSSASRITNHVPFRKQLKDEAKQKRAAARSRQETSSEDTKLDSWELTVGIEVHAQLNTERKLFSRATTSITDEPNTHVALFDLAYPGAQPIFQQATLIPALRAAVALNCQIQRSSSFDRKHYFYQDQPAGYQITQYYEPFAKDGNLKLYDYDGIAPDDGNCIEIGIKQIQMEQDTAKTIQQPPDTMLLDFNRVGHPLIEIITLPQIHHPKTAAACVRKIQASLQAVNAVVTGMELGGLRADVNVSVRPKGAGPGDYSYSGISGLGQRTEIKNLSSFKAIEDAIVAERDRQISVLEAGGSIEGETRGWSLGSTVTRKLRGKEGEVDYRYMPDADLSPVIIEDALINHIKNTLPVSPDDIIEHLVRNCHVTVKDAMTLVSLDNGERLDYFDEVVTILGSNDDLSTEAEANAKYGKTTANWVLHELGALLSATEKPFSTTLVRAEALASIIQHLLQGKITGKTAKQLLSMAFNGDARPINEIVEQDDLALKVLSREEYLSMAQQLCEVSPDMVQKVRNKGQTAKLKWFVGQMMRVGEGKVEAEKAEAILKEVLGIQ